MRNISKPLLVGGGLVLTAIAAFLAFGVFGIQTLFIDDVVDEANPFEVVAEATEPAETAPADEAPDEEAAEDEPAVDEAADVPPEEAPEEEAPTTPEIVTVTTGSFVSNSRYTTVGTGLTITDGTQTFLRFEGFETSNGPDLVVYLRNSDDPDDYIDLGRLSGNIGDQNYELPAGIDLDRYDFVDIWCDRFSVSFGNAQLSAA